MENHQAQQTTDRPRRPNLFLLGAGRCGTTFLHQQMHQHPDIFMSPDKEPTFFCDFFGMQNPWEYLELFRSASTERVVGESSHAYLSCPTSALMLKAFCPEAKFIVIFRNPVDRAYSLYCWMTAAGNEWLSPFDRALAAEEFRAHDARFRQRNPQYFYNYLYFRSGRYGSQVSRYLQLFARHQFLFLRFDDLTGDPGGVLRRVFQFLDVDPNFVPQDQSPANPSHTVRSARLQFLLRRRVEPMLIKLRLARARRLIDWTASRNLRATRPAAVPVETRLQLIDRYREDLALLERLTGFDTSGWRQTREF